MVQRNDSNSGSVPDDDQPPALLNAIFDADVDKVKNLLQQGDDPNVLGPEDVGFIHVVLDVVAGRPDLASKMLEVTHLLLRAGINPNQADIDGITPLIKAANVGDGDIAKALLAAGADPELKDTYGYTATRRAQLYQHYNVAQVIENFNASKSDDDVLGKDGVTVSRPEVDYDVLISGGGPTGLAVALEAVKNGLKIAIISNRPPDFLRVQRIGLAKEDVDYLLGMISKDEKLNEKDSELKELFREEAD